MALIGDVEVFILDEDVNRSVEVTKHPVEQGIDLTDNIKPEAVTITLKGEIVGEDASVRLKKLKSLMNKGEIVTYSGRNIQSNCQIINLNTSHPYKISGGCSFTISLKEVRIAAGAYNGDAVAKGGTRQIERNNDADKVYHTVKAGESVWALVSAPDAPYKSYGKDCNWVMENNPEAFGRKGDFTTLKIGAKLYIGDRREK